MPATVGRSPLPNSWRSSYPTSRARAVTKGGIEPNDGSFRVTRVDGPILMANLTIELARSAPLPCEPGRYKVSFCDQAANVVRSVEVTVAARATVTATIELP